MKLLAYYLLAALVAHLLYTYVPYEAVEPLLVFVGVCVFILGALAVLWAFILTALEEDNQPPEDEWWHEVKNQIKKQGYH